MYEFTFRGPFDESRPESITFHRGSLQDHIKRHQKCVDHAWRDGLRGVKELAPTLVKVITDERNLRAAWDHLATKGGPSPGPNGLSYRGVSGKAIWALCRCLRDAIRTQSYRPGPERVRRIPKANGRDFREIAIIDIEDRVVQRGIFTCLQPIFDRLFDERSLGYRPKRDRLHALAIVEKLTLTEGRRIWITEDIRDAFSQVPLPRLLQIVEKILPSSELIDLLSCVLQSEHLPGLRQGGPLSPLMLNVYLNRFLDRPWRNEHPRVPMIRYADDVMVLCKTMDEARFGHDELKRLLDPAGMPLKGTRESAIHDLDAGAAVEWLGFAISKTPGGLAVEIASSSWNRLRQNLELIHTRSDAPLRAKLTIHQWLNQQGPCYRWSDREKVCKRIIRLARKQRFEEIPGIQELVAHWQRASARWAKLRKSIGAAC